MKKSFLFIAMFIFALLIHAQIGYQVSLLNSATGEPRANETVSCTATISGQESTIFTSTQNVTSNEFGVLSLTIGNADMFSNVDWTVELPLFVEITVDGKLVGKSQVLSVPVAEAAKAVVPNKDIVGAWSGRYVEAEYDYWEDLTLALNEDGTAIYHRKTSSPDVYKYNGIYFCVGDIVYISHPIEGGDNGSIIFYYNKGKLYLSSGTILSKQ